VEGGYVPQEDTQFHPYQDDLDTDDTAIDPIIDEETDDPVETLQIPADEFKKEMDNLALDEHGHDSEDMREMIEDRDEDMGENER
jgi:hypothetical protein